MRLAGIPFSGRWAAANYVAATLWVQQLALLPSLLSLTLLVVVWALGIALLLWRKDVALRERLLRILIPGFCGALGFSVATCAAQQRLSDQLPRADENRVSKVVFQVAELPRLRPDSRQFVARVLRSHPAGVPQRIVVGWAAPDWAGPYAERKSHDFPDLYPGQIWQANVIVKTPHAALNPNGFDYESHLFAQGIRAVASVRGSPRLLEVQPLAERSLSLMAESLRHGIREKMLPFLDGMRYGGVITALSIGDQASISAEDWAIFNRSGLTHLVSISGAHVTLIASLVAALAAWAWRRCQIKKTNLAELIPAQNVAAYIAVGVAGLYCVVAGWGVPAQRTFLMLAIIVFSYLWRLPLNGSQVLAIAAVAVLVLDPWAIISSGFWLSFGAVAVLFACSNWQGNKHSSYGGIVAYAENIKTASMWQLLITAALFPPLAMLFNEISLISPLSNAYAIPLISLLVTPLSLLFAATSTLSVLDPFSAVVAWVCHSLITLMMVPTVWLCELPAASIPVAQAPVWSYVLALLAIAIAMTPRAITTRNYLWLLVLPCLLWGRERMAPGDWRLTALDVGQGSAIIVQTTNSSLLFDTGVRRARDSDMGAQVIVPFLRSIGLSALDVLVVSHADLDHVGGTASVLQQYPVQQSYSSFDLQRHMGREARLLDMAGDSIPLPLAMAACTRGTKWEVDGVRFEFIWPVQTSSSVSSTADRNANSCVLSIRGPWHSALLTGDIGHRQELTFVESGLESHDVVVVGHHGSNTSSGQAFVNQVEAQVAIAQAGWWSRFGHPHSEVEQRWLRSGSAFFRSDLDGAVSVLSSSRQLGIERERLDSRRYWHNHNAYYRKEPD